MEYSYWGNPYIFPLYLYMTFLVTLIMTISALWKKKVMIIFPLQAFITKS